MLTSRGKRALLVLALLIIVGVFSIYAVYFSNWLIVKEINVTGLQRLTEEEVLAKANIELNAPLIELNAENKEAEILQITTVKTVEVRKGWPNKVVVAVQERSPIALTDLTDGRYLVDDTGRAFRRAGPDDVHPFVFAPTDSARGLAARVSRVIPDWIVSEVTRIESLDAKYAILVLNSGRRIIWGDESQADQKAAVLLALLRVEEGDIDISTVEVPVLKLPAE